MTTRLKRSSSLSDPANRTYVMVTGANSGVGLATCQRLIDEFVKTRLRSKGLTIVFTTRDDLKATKTREILQKYVAEKHCIRDPSVTSRIAFLPELVDLTSLASVLQCAMRLRTAIPHLDCVILNAGVGGNPKINWPLAIWRVMTQPRYAVSFPDYVVTDVGLLTPPQKRFKPAAPSAEGKPVPDLGQVFTSNLFGHYCLAHVLMPMLALSSDGGRIIFVSSLEAYPGTFSLSDIQGLTSDHAYGSSKRLTDLLILNSSSPSSAPFTKQFMSLPPNVPQEREKSPALFLAQPGYCVTSFIPIPRIMVIPMTIMFYMARLIFGSIWHTVSPYKASAAQTWLALTPREELEELEREEGKGKWGSYVDRWGKEGVIRTGVAGWGIGGGARPYDDEYVPHATGPAAVGGLDTATREKFDELGRACWQTMEEMRVQWRDFLLGQ